MGLRSKQAGDAVERVIKFGADRYRAEGRAMIAKLPVATAQNRAGRIFRQRAPFDWFGSIAYGVDPDGYPQGSRFVLPFAMETKGNTTRKPSLPVTADTRRPGLAAHQLESLADWIEFGGVGVVLWDNSGQALRISGSSLVHVRDRYRSGGRRSIAVGEFDEVDSLDRFLDGL